MDCAQYLIAQRLANFGLEKPMVKKLRKRKKVSATFLNSVENFGRSVSFQGNE